MNKQEYCQLIHTMIKKGAKLIDVRSRNEFQANALSSALNLPLQDISNALNLVDKSDTLMVYCQSGARSQQAAQYLHMQGYKNVYDLGGIANIASCSA